MSNKEYETAKKEREKKDIKASIIIFSTMLLSLVGSIIYIVVNR